MAMEINPNTLIFSNSNFSTPDGWEKLTNVRVMRDSVKDLEIPFESICLLDSEASETMKPEDAALFDYFLFGGILGNSILYVNYVII